MMLGGLTTRLWVLGTWSRLQTIGLQLRCVALHRNDERLHLGGECCGQSISES